MTQGLAPESLFFMNEATRRFIQEHRMEDVRQLALKGGKGADIDMPMALQQIAGWQTARKKLPAWAEMEDIIYPPHLNMEQCSSEETALYKESLTPCPSPSERGVFVDLTGGFGVDFSYMSRAFERRIYVERNPELCEIARHNFQCLGLEAEVVCAEAEDYLKEMAPVDVIYLDPARRDQQGSRTYGIADCSPNVIELLPLLREKAQCIILKLSPMLDWRKAVSDLEGVQEVHIVSVGNECKELLLVLGSKPSEGLLLVCVNDGRAFSLLSKEGTFYSQGGNDLFPRWECFIPKVGIFAGNYLFEPNASIMKAGCFREVSQTFGVQQLSANSHLFVADHDVADFPGRRFLVESSSSMNKQELKSVLKPVTQANIAVRNFPMTAEMLRKKLKIKDGGDVFIFGTTLSDGSHQLFICRKIG